MHYYSLKTLTRHWICSEKNTQFWLWKTWQGVSNLIWIQPVVRFKHIKFWILNWFDLFSLVWVPDCNCSLETISFYKNTCISLMVDNYKIDLEVIRLLDAILSFVESGTMFTIWKKDNSNKTGFSSVKTVQISKARIKFLCLQKSNKCQGPNIKSSVPTECNSQKIFCIISFSYQLTLFNLKIWSPQTNVWVSVRLTSIKTRLFPNNDQVKAYCISWIAGKKARQLSRTKSYEKTFLLEKT